MNYDPDFSYAVEHRRKAARMALIGYALTFLLGCSIVGAAAVVVYKYL